MTASRRIHDMAGVIEFASLGNPEQVRMRDEAQGALGVMQIDLKAEHRAA